jgi:hypothetical protein
VRLHAALVLGLCACPIGAAAQPVSGFGQAFNVERRIYYRGAVYQQTGLWYGAIGAVRLGRMQLGVSALMGTASGGGAASPDIQIRTTAVTLHYMAAPWIALGVQAEARRFESDAGVTMWRLIGGNVRLEPGLGVAGLRGIAEISVLPASSVSGGPSLQTAMQAAIGAGFAPARSPLDFRVVYRFERYDVAASGTSPERYEQFRGVVAQVGIRLGR